MREAVAFTLKRSGFLVATAVDAMQADKLLKQIYPSMILLGQLPPGASALGFAKRLKSRETTSGVPIVKLTTRLVEDKARRGLAAGIVDYLAKPSCDRDLVVKVKDALASSNSASATIALEINGLHIDPFACRVTVHDRPVELDRPAFRMLYFLMRHPERAFTRSQLLDSVWGSNVYAEIRNVDVHICQLRKALSPHGYDRLIQTVRGRGYRLSVHAS